MPLSDRERKQLEELESGLAADDPRLAEELSTGSVGLRFGRRIYLGAIACLIGLVLLIVGVSTQIIVVGVGGFLLMGAGTYLLVDKRSFSLGRSRQVK
ncbi:DUF3040 domain-containing protein [Pseudarthrobacter sp. MDT3-26]|uniref:DUF3040 domain-containing protein n=1 Tax=Pseudarthrobacter raffinosi TaxID=2953651 RepID=UPI00208EAC3B|nr:DUF3040 domain-containing protein [Pseudarthrobacter sp. MDT3-26]MCO4263951.1 DUF3040 domain-containing protein [Pseudarthrobacter sp. MDT3-26]